VFGRHSYGVLKYCVLSKLQFHLLVIVCGARILRIERDAVEEHVTDVCMRSYGGIRSEIRASLPIARLVTMFCVR
jgi:hypothetical protein